MELMEQKTAKTHGKLMVTVGTLIAVSFFADRSKNYEILGLGFEPANAHIVLSLLVIVFFAMWLHAFLLDGKIVKSKLCVKEWQEENNIIIPKERIECVEEFGLSTQIDFEFPQQNGEDYGHHQYTEDILDPDGYSKLKDDVDYGHKIIFLKNGYKVEFSEEYRLFILKYKKEIKNSIYHKSLPLSETALGHSYAGKNVDFSQLSYKKEIIKENSKKILVFNIGYYIHLSLAVLSFLLAIFFLLSI